MRTLFYVAAFVFLRSTTWACSPEPVLPCDFDYQPYFYKIENFKSDLPAGKISVKFKTDSKNNDFLVIENETNDPLYYVSPDPGYDNNKILFKDVDVQVVRFSKDQSYRCENHSKNIAISLNNRDDYKKLAKLKWICEYMTDSCSDQHGENYLEVKAQYVAKYFPDIFRIEKKPKSLTVDLNENFIYKDQVFSITGQVILKENTKPIQISCDKDRYRSCGKNCFELMDDGMFFESKSITKTAKVKTNFGNWLVTATLVDSSEGTGFGVERDLEKVLQKAADQVGKVDKHLVDERLGLTMIYIEVRSSWSHGSNLIKLKFERL